MFYSVLLLSFTTFRENNMFTTGIYTGFHPVFYHTFHHMTVLINIYTYMFYHVSLYD